MTSRFQATPPTTGENENSTSNGGGNPTNFEEENDRNDNTNFECNICLDIARDAVISLCGHLFW